MKSLSVARQFSRTPGSRYIREGDSSGELFRTSVLVPAVRDARVAGERIQIDLDGTAGYGTSFLEEAFGGLVRANKYSAAELRDTIVLKSDEESYLIADIWGYIEDAEKASSNEGQGAR